MRQALRLENSRKLRVLPENSRRSWASQERQKSGRPYPRLIVSRPRLLVYPRAYPALARGYWALCSRPRIRGDNSLIKPMSDGGILFEDGQHLICGARRQCKDHPIKTQLDQRLDHRGVRANTKNTEIWPALAIRLLPCIQGLCYSRCIVQRAARIRAAGVLINGEPAITILRNTLINESRRRPK